MGEQSITQIVERFEGAFLEILTESLTGDLLNGLKSCKTRILSKTCETISAIISVLDDMVNSSVERKKSSLVVQRRGDSRTISTEIGEITYKRTYYRHKKTGEFSYLLDYLIGADSYERLSKELSISLLKLAKDMSYQKAAEYVEPYVSRQTVNNRLLSLRNVAADIEAEKKVCDEINIYVDEDHVAAHGKDGRKKSVIVPVAVASSGTDYSSPKRPRLKDPLYLAEFGVDCDVFYDNLYSMISRRFNLDNDPDIYIHADGANWIKNYEIAFPGATFVMDGFHIEKYLKKIKTYCTKDISSQITKAVRKGSLDSFEKWCDKALEEIENANDREKFIRLRSYFENNFEGIERRELSDVCGSCTEAMVSHVTAERLSRTGCAWSLNGLGQMTMLLTLYKNGGSLKKEDICVSRNKEVEDARKASRKKIGYEKYTKYLDQERAEIIKAYRERVSKRACDYVIDTTSGTQILLKLLSRIPTTT